MSQTLEYGLDTSAAIPLLVASHEAHTQAATWANGRTLGLCGHALIETYSVLTRLPGDARVNPRDAVALINDNFSNCLMLSPDLASRTHQKLSELGVSGGAAYDGLVALAASEHRVILVTRDARARSTYEACGVQVEVLC
ncbi:MAG: type II toxin-antitoxin system VapC family toxin [Propionibacteriaceae bacterium]|nr:type II toxin-antitoxin system VapC family toxin [Propionibacteriaceae bacterium]